jgi:hypothetical protein
MLRRRIFRLRGLFFSSKEFFSEELSGPGEQLSRKESSGRRKLRAKNYPGEEYCGEESSGEEFSGEEFSGEECSTNREIYTYRASALDMFLSKWIIEFNTPGKFILL